jgi:membrane protease YdiL (CAAX protease family)
MNTAGGDRDDTIDLDDPVGGRRSGATRQQAEAPAGRRVPWPAIGLGGAIAAVALVVLGLVGELGAFLSSAPVTVPFVMLALLATLGERYGWARWLTYLYLVLLNLGLLVVSLGLVFAVSGGPRLSTIDRAPPAEALALLRPALVYLAIGLLLVLLGWLPLLPPVRRRLERLLPLRAGSLLNVAGLSTMLTLAALALAALAVLNGQPPLLTLVQGVAGDAVHVRPQDQIYQFVWLLPASLVFVGWPLRRGFGAALARLGLVRPSLRQVALGAGVGIVLVGVVLVLDPAIARLWEALGWPRTDTLAFEKLMAGLISPLGAVVIGVTAGLGEELAVRGVLQPRLGLLLANLAFTAAHAYQYSWDGLLVVFLIGLALGALRARTNTSTSAIAHGVYDFILVLASALGM